MPSEDTGTGFSAGTSLVPGQRTWSCTRDEQGHREYKIVHLVKGETTDGPANALNTVGLPLPGAPWIFDDDEDQSAWCRPNATVTPVVENEPNKYFLVEQIFSTKPSADNRCQDQKIEDPLLELPQVSGAGNKFNEEATHDRFGFPIITSSFEQIRGNQVEFENANSTVKIQMNVPVLLKFLYDSMMNTVNIEPMWGIPRRCIKLSNYTWEKKYYGFCYVYYSVTFEFDINYKTFDRDLLDEGTKVLSGRWDNATGQWILVKVTTDTDADPDPDPMNPQHYIKYTDRQGNACRVVLDGDGLPAGIPITQPDDLVSACIPPLEVGQNSPVNWKLTVSGVDTASNDDDEIICEDCRAVNGVFTITHAPNAINDCNWQSEILDIDEENCEWNHSTEGGIIWSLFVTVTEITVDLLGPLVPITWFIPIADFKPLSRNTLTLRTATDDCNWNAHSITIEPLFENITAIGSIHVEKYQESNFLILGIPLTL